MWDDDQTQFNEYYFKTFIEDASSSDEIINVKIEGVEGVDISNFSDFLDQEEVLVPKKNKYKIKEIKEEKVKQKWSGNEITIKHIILQGNSINKGSKTYEVGQISQTTGLKKVAPGKWIDPKTGKEVKTDENGSIQGAKKEPIDVSKMSDKELLEYAKNSSEADLQKVIKESNNPM
jgi:hypothetical protein